MQENIIIRAATEQDAEAVIAHMKMIGDETDNLTFDSKALEGLTVATEASFLKSQQERASFLIAVDGNEVIGSANFSIGGRKRIRHVGELGIAVQKKYWGQGIGSALLERVIANAKAAGIRKLNLTVRSDNQEAIRLYKKFGFCHEGTTSRMFCIGNQWICGEYFGLEL
ncbi:MAG: GNAT family N-acetyltransferase [Spirochaetia bacterium]|nr:GNAT family N-acetyltransferase [Spirochaetia bacterium]